MPSHKELPDPTPLAMILCDGFSRDGLNDKLHLNGLFGTFVTASVPFHATFAAYAAITNIRRSQACHFEIIDAQNNTIARSEEVQLQKPADLMVETVIANYFTNVELPEYGNYFVQFWTRKGYIMERRLLVVAPEIEEQL